MTNFNQNGDTLAHYGVKGMKWGVRRYQNADGSLTAKGVKRYAIKGYAQDSFNGNKTTAGKVWDAYTGAHKTQAKVKYDTSSNKQNKARAEKYLAEKNSTKKSSMSAKSKQQKGQGNANDVYFEKTKRNTVNRTIGRGMMVAGVVLRNIGQQQYNMYKNNSSPGRTAVINGLGYSSKILSTLGPAVVVGSQIQQYSDYKDWRRS